MMLGSGSDEVWRCGYTHMIVRLLCIPIDEVYDYIENSPFHKPPIPAIKPVSEVGYALRW